MEKDLTFKEENLREEALNMSMAMAMLTVSAEINEGIRGRRSNNKFTFYFSFFI